MASGDTVTGSLSDSLPKVIAQARIVDEYKGVMNQLVDRVRLGEGVGNDWHEISLGKLTASAITETTEEDNPQQLSDTILTITPQVVSVHTAITHRTARNISKNVWAKVGALGQNAIVRKKDQDGLVELDSASTSLGGAGVTLSIGHPVAGAFQVRRGGGTEPWSGPVAIVLHSYQGKDIFDDLVGGIGTYPVPAGPSADVFKGGWTLPIAGAQVFMDDLLTIDGSDDVKGGVFASGKGGAIVLCQARAPWIDVVENKKLGGGATETLHRDEYAYGERQDAWKAELYSDATAPTS